MSPSRKEATALRTQLEARGKETKALTSRLADIERRDHMQPVMQSVALGFEGELPPEWQSEVLMKFFHP
jgi:hypothetical protein